jgi:hypothetical protein
VLQPRYCKTVTGYLQVSQTLSQWGDLGFWVDEIVTKGKKVFLGNLWQPFGIRYACTLQDSVPNFFFCRRGPYAYKMWQIWWKQTWKTHAVIFICAHTNLISWNTCLIFFKDVMIWVVIPHESTILCKCEQIVPLFNYVIKHHTMKAYGVVEVKSHLFFLPFHQMEVRVSFTPLPHYHRGKNPRYPLDRSLGGPQSRSGRHAEEKILDPTVTGTPIPRSFIP